MDMYEPHELASFLPAMNKGDFERLKDDIARNGLLEPVVLYEDQILDGIHRDRACNELGIDAHYEDYEGTDPARYVFSKNISRRHLSNSQKAMIGAQLEGHFAKVAKRRQGTRTDLKRNIKADRPRSSQVHQARDDAAEIVGTSARSVARAKRIRIKRPDLAKKIEANEMSLSTADGIISADKVRVKQEPAVEQPEPTQPTIKLKNFNGKTNATRAKEIKEERKRTGKYTDLLKLQLEMTKLCRVLEDYHPDDFGLDTTTADLIADFHEDLISLGEWWERAILATTAWVSDLEYDDKISKLRKKTAANGCPPGEVENAKSIIAKLERARAAILEAGDPV